MLGSDGKLSLKVAEQIYIGNKLNFFIMDIYKALIFLY